VLAPGDTILLADGIYQGPLTLPSGTKEKRITVAAIPGATPVLTTAILNKDSWSIHKGTVYVADFSRMAGLIDTENPQLFVDGESLVEARFPNMGPTMSSIMSYRRAVAQTGTDKSQIVSPAGLPDGLGGATVVVWPGDNGLSGWVAWKSPVAFVKDGIVHLGLELDASESLSGQNAYSPRKGNPFYVTGALALLDAPGEYYYDRKAKRMYVCMPAKDSPSKYRITVRGKLSVVISARNASFITLRGLSLYGGGIDMTGSDGCLLDSCAVRYADHFQGSGYASYTGLPRSTAVIGNGNRITKCEFGPTASDGILLGGNDNVFTDNIVHDCDYSGNDYAAVFVKQSSNLEISNSLFLRSARAHIFFDIQQTYGKCVIRNNHFRDHATLNSDAGAFYTWSSDGGGTTLRNNFVECGTMNDNGTMMKLREGLYIDNYSSNFTVHHNIVVGGISGLRTNLPNRNTVFANNTVIGASHGYGVFSLSKDEAEGRITSFFNNLFVGLTGMDISYYGSEGGAAKSYNGNLVEGCVPIPFSEAERIRSSYNSRGEIDGGYRPVAGSMAVDGGIRIPGITDGFLGAEPDIGAIEAGGVLFPFGPSWSLPIR
jgi:hypothetical protein